MSIVGVGVAVGVDVVFSHRGVVVFAWTVELGHRTDVEFWNMVGTALVVFSHRPVVLLEPRVGIEVLSQIGLVLLTSNERVVETLCHMLVLLGKDGLLLEVRLNALEAVAFQYRPVVLFAPVDMADDTLAAMD